MQSWVKFELLASQGSFSEPGLYGNCDMLTNMHDASSVRYRRLQEDFISVQQSSNVGLQVMHSLDGLNFEQLPVILVPTD
jgi:hypothetical protein